LPGEERIDPPENRRSAIQAMLGRNDQKEICARIDGYDSGRKAPQLRSRNSRGETGFDDQLVELEADPAFGQTGFGERRSCRAPLAAITPDNELSYGDFGALFHIFIKPNFVVMT
jgi:hypothetical protein